MPIRPYIEEWCFEPDIVALMGDAFEQAIRAFPGRQDTQETKEMVANRIIAAVRLGERDVGRLRAIGVGLLPATADKDAETN